MVQQESIVQPGRMKERERKKKRCSCVIFDNSTMGVM